MRLLTMSTRPAHAPPITAKSVIGRENPDRPEAQRRRNGAFLLRHAQLLWRACRAGFGLAGSPLVPGFSPRHVRHLNRVRTIGDGSSDHRSHMMRNHAQGMPTRYSDRAMAATTSRMLSSNVWRRTVKAPSHERSLNHE